jgi:hypothetical protein
MKLQNAILHYGTKVVLLSHRDIYDLTVYTILLVYVFQSLQLLQLRLIMFQLNRGQGQTSSRPRPPKLCPRGVLVDEDSPRGSRTPSLLFTSLYRPIYSPIKAIYIWHKATNRTYCNLSIICMTALFIDVKDLNISLNCQVFDKEQNA